MSLRWPAILACAVFSALAAAQEMPVARELIKEAEEHCDNLSNKDARAYWYSQIAQTLQPIDKNAALVNLENAAKSLPASSWAWSDVLRVWVNQNPDAAFQHALALKSSDEGPERIGEVIALVGGRDVDKATKQFAEVPTSIKQQVAQFAVRGLAVYNQDVCDTFIQSITSVNRDPLYKIVARECGDPQIALKAARKAGKDSPVAMVAAIEKIARDNAAAAFTLVSELADPGLRAEAIALCAESFNVSDPEKAKQCANLAIELYNQLPPEWESRPRHFVAIAPHISAIDSPEVREFLLRFTDSVETHFKSVDDEEYATLPAYLLVCAGAWSRLDIEKSRAIADRALQIEPEAGIRKTPANGVDARPSYLDYLVEVAKTYPDEAAVRLNTIRGSNAMFADTARIVFSALLPSFVSQSRQIAKELGGPWPNFVEVERNLGQPNPENAADALLRLGSSSFAGAQFWQDAVYFTDLLIQSDPYRAVKTINLMDSRAHRIPLLARVIIATATSNVGLANSLFEGARTNINLDMPAEDKVHARLELAKAAIALRK